jgi:hypothetical protein
MLDIDDDAKFDINRGECRHMQKKGPSAPRVSDRKSTNHAIEGGVRPPLTSNPAGDVMPVVKAATIRAKGRREIQTGTLPSVDDSDQLGQHINF